MSAISEEILDQLVRWAEDSLPNEACGLLMRTVTGELAIARLDNDHADPARNFSFGAKTLLESFSLMQARKRAFLGTWHSHPTQDAMPSLNDRRGCVTNSPEMHIIVGRTGNEGEWVVRLFDGEFCKILGSSVRTPNPRGLVYADPSKSDRT